MKNTLLILFCSVLLFCSCGDDSTNPVENDVSCDREIVRNCTQTMAMGFSNIFSNIIENETQRVEYLRAYAANARYFSDSSGYFYVEDLDAIMIAHGFKPELIGTSRIDVQDSKGNFYVREMLDSVKGPGSGFIDFYFTNPANGKDELKIGFVSKIPGHEFFIGSGYYADQSSIGNEDLSCGQLMVQNVVHSISGGVAGVFANIISDSFNRNKLLASFLTNLKIESEKESYFLALNKSGICVANSYNHEIIGVDLSDATDISGFEYISQIINGIDSSNVGFLEIRIPSSETGTLKNFYLYYELIQPSGLILIGLNEVE